MTVVCTPWRAGGIVAAREEKRVFEKFFQKFIETESRPPLERKEFLKSFFRNSWRVKGPRVIRQVGHPVKEKKSFEKVF